MKHQGERVSLLTKKLSTEEKKESDGQKVRSSKQQQTHPLDPEQDPIKSLYGMNSPSLKVSNGCSSYPQQHYTTEHHFQ